ncbi:MAG: hypothetical protein ABI577_00225 [bacterium]
MLSRRGKIDFGAGKFMDIESPEQLIHAARSGMNTDPAWYEVAAIIDGWAWSDEEARDITSNLKCAVHIAHGNPALGSMIRREGLQSLDDAGLAYSATYFETVGHVISAVIPRPYLADLKQFLESIL